LNSIILCPVCKNKRLCFYLFIPMDILDVNSMASSAASHDRDLHGIGGSRYRDFDRDSARVTGLVASSHGATNPATRERFQAAIDLAGGKASSRNSSRRWAKLVSEDASSTFRKVISVPYIQALIIWVVAAGLLYMLAPPIVCNSNDDDDLDAYKCNPSRVILWAAVAPLAFTLIPYFYGTMSPEPVVVAPG
jgi:hypothetical protein